MAVGLCADHTLPVALLQSLKVLSLASCPHVLAPKASAVALPPAPHLLARTRPLQWFKGYWDEVTGGHDITDYDAAGRRQLCKTGDWKRVGGRGGQCGQSPGTWSSCMKACPAFQADLATLSLPLGQPELSGQGTTHGASPPPQFTTAGGAAAPRAAAGTIPAVRRTGTFSGEGSAAAAPRAAPRPAPAAKPAAVPVVAPKPVAVPAVDDSHYRSQLAELNEQVGAAAWPWTLGAALGCKQLGPRAAPPQLERLAQRCTGRPGQPPLACSS